MVSFAGQSQAAQAVVSDGGSGSEFGDVEEKGGVAIAAFLAEQRRAFTRHILERNTSERAAPKAEGFSSYRVPS